MKQEVFFKVRGERFAVYCSADLSKSHKEDEDKEYGGFTWYNTSAVYLYSNHCRIAEIAEESLTNGWLNILKKGGNEYIQPISKETYLKYYNLATEFGAKFKALENEYRMALESLEEGEA